MRRVLAYAAFGVAVVSAIVLSGIVPLESDGHWAITSWVLDFTKQRSIATHSLNIDVPPLDDPALIARGAGHYEYGCRPCHGSPGTAMPPVPARMTPHPPDLPRQVGRWTPEQLFSIIRGGIKFTGMPAWPAPTREDEVWAVVAFTRLLPKMTYREYRQLIPAEPAAAEESSSETRLPVAALARSRCAPCHGAMGKGRTQAVAPRLAGQKSEYLARALRAFANGRRHSGTMAVVAASLSAKDIDELADYVAAVPLMAASGGAVDPAAAQLATEGAPAQNIPACRECHHANPLARNPGYPRLDGQFADYLRAQLRLFKTGRRGGSEYADIMRLIAARLTDEQAAAAAAYFEKNPAPLEPAGAP